MYYKGLPRNRGNAIRDAIRKGSELVEPAKENIQKREEEIKAAFKKARREEIIEAKVASTKEWIAARNLKNLNTFGEFEKFLNQCGEARKNALQITNPQEDQKKLEESNARVEVLKEAFRESLINNIDFTTYCEGLSEDRKDELQRAIDEAWDLKDLVITNIKKRIQETKDAFKDASREELIEARVASCKELYIKAQLNTFGEFEELLKQCGEDRKKALQSANSEEDLRHLEEMSNARVNALKVALDHDGFKRYLNELPMERRNAIKSAMEEGKRLVKSAKENIQTRVEEISDAFKKASREEIIEARIAATKEWRLNRLLLPAREFEKLLQQCGEARKKALKIANREEDLRKLEESNARVEVLKEAFTEYQIKDINVNTYCEEVSDAFWDAIKEGEALVASLEKREEDLYAVILAASREEVIEARIEAVNEGYIKAQLNTFGEFEELLKQCGEDRKKALQSANSEEDLRHLEEMSNARVNALKVAFIELGRLMFGDPSMSEHDRWKACVEADKAALKLVENAEALIKGHTLKEEAHKKEQEALAEEEKRRAAPRAALSEDEGGRE